MQLSMMENRSIYVDTNFRTVTSLSGNDIQAERFSRLMQGMNVEKAGKPSDESSKNVAPVESKKDSFALRVYKDVAFLQKGVDTILKMNSKTADDGKYLDKKEGMAPLGKPMYDLTKFGYQYYIATNFVAQAGTHTSEELQVFTQK